MTAKIKKVLLVINPIAGDSDKQPIIEMVEQYLDSDVELRIYTTTGDDDITNIGTEIKDFEPNRVLVAGGDGTVKMVAEASRDFKLVVGILPAGSANGLATDLDLPKDSKRALITAMGNQTIKMDALRIGDSIGLHISDLGINAELIHKYSENSVRGHFGYFLSSIPALLETESPYKFTITANGEDRKVEAVMVAFANSQKFGTGALVNPNGKLDDGKFEVLIFKKLDVLEIIKTLRGNIDMDPDFVEVIQTTEVRVTTEKPVSFQIDGEPDGTQREVNVTILPNYIEIATGL
ncbi:hypothetical protein LCGC14_0580170 [marine sediment metagenome]|uniref:Diacylglycerol kinase n=2 Tax=root TaxID=1 RepID=A0A831QQC1_9FLAO|nr:diacylglycerol kinase [Pricia antarctica]